MKGKTIVVTGGAGFIGSHLVDRLIQEKPKEIIVIDNLHLGKESNLDYAKSIYLPYLKFYNISANSFIDMYRIFDKEKPDVVFSLAVIPLPESLSNPYGAFTTNIEMTSILCELQRSKKFETLIHFSSSEAYGTAKYIPMDEDHPLLGTTPYAASKSACDQLIYSYGKLFNIDYSIIRPFNNYGPRQNDGLYAGIIPLTIKNIYNNLPITIFGDGKQTRDYIYVKDTAEFAIRIYNNKATRSKVINVGNGVEIKINEIINKLCDITDYDKNKIKYEDERPADVRRHCSNSKLCESLVNIIDKTSLYDGLKETINWYMEKYHEDSYFK